MTTIREAFPVVAAYADRTIARQAEQDIVTRPLREQYGSMTKAEVLALCKERGLYLPYKTKECGVDKLVNVTWEQSATRQRHADEKDAAEQDVLSYLVLNRNLADAVNEYVKALDSLAGYASDTRKKVTETGYIDGTDYTFSRANSVTVAHSKVRGLLGLVRGVTRGATGLDEHIAYLLKGPRQSFELDYVYSVDSFVRDLLLPEDEKIAAVV